MKHFTTVYDIPEPCNFIQQAIASKEKKNSFPGKGKTIGLVFMNPSLRTRLSTQKAALDLGMNVMVLNLEKESWTIEWEDGAIMNSNKTEHIREAAQMLSLYCDIIGIRCFASLTDFEKDYTEFNLLQLMRFATVPVISLESATRHPLQSLADVITINEDWNFNIRKPKVVLTWAPHVKALPQAVPNSFCEWMQFLDAEFVIANPEGYDLSSDFTKNIPVIHNQLQALESADYVYAKNWSSFSEYGAMPPVKENWLLNDKKLSVTNNAKIMHCLPVRRNVELPDFLLAKERSLILEQAENRYFAAKFVLTEMLKSCKKKEVVGLTDELIYE